MFIREVVSKRIELFINDLVKSLEFQKLQLITSSPSKLTNLDPHRLNPNVMDHGCPDNNRIIEHNNEIKTIATHKGSLC